MPQVLRETKLIVWNESNMVHNGGMETLYRLMKYIGKNDTWKGGVTILLAGDF